jgi:hypothetical protein
MNSSKIILNNNMLFLNYGKKIILSIKNTPCFINNYNFTYLGENIVQNNHKINDII